MERYGYMLKKNEVHGFPYHLLDKYGNWTPCCLKMAFSSQKLLYEEERMIVSPFLLLSSRK
jgi:hypothetical protein